MILRYLVEELKEHFKPTFQEKLNETIDYYLCWKTYCAEEFYVDVWLQRSGLSRDEFYRRGMELIGKHPLEVLDPAEVARRVVEGDEPPVTMEELVEARYRRNCS